MAHVNERKAAGFSLAASQPDLANEIIMRAEALSSLVARRKAGKLSEGTAFSEIDRHALELLTLAGANEKSGEAVE